MKAGTERKTKLISMFVLATTAAFFAGGLMTSLTPKRGGMPTREPAREQATAASPLGVQLELLSDTERAEYLGGGRNIFKKVDPPRLPDPQPPIKRGIQQAETPPVPAIGLKFFGFARRLGHAARVFLTEGEDVFIAGEGEIVNRRYRVVRISPASVEIEDVLTNHSEHIPLSQG